MNAPLSDVPTLVLHGIACKLDELEDPQAVATIRIGELATTPDAVRAELVRRGLPGTSLRKARGL